MAVFVVLASQLFSVLCIFLLSMSFYAHVFRLPDNKCEMTYMFQFPEYLEIPLPKQMKHNFPRYGLYVYGEGAYAERLSRGGYRGIPVLFIPGNAGSYKQVRSLASVSLKKTEAAGHVGVPEFNYFSIDFDEELSGLYGGYLQRQTEFAGLCLRRILALYKGMENRPASVIVIGHSMGGIIARGLFKMQNISSLINVVITLASPHAAPPATFDFAFDDYYTHLNNYWSENVNVTLQNVTLLSIGGGRRDVMVRPALTLFEHRLKASVPDSQSNSRLATFETTATLVPLVWASTDHLCIVWCKQLVLAVVRALFDMIDRSNRRSDQMSLSSNISVQRTAISYHFFERDDWKLNKDTVRTRNARLEEEILWQGSLWSKLAAVFRDYVHYTPGFCLYYICITSAVDDILQSVQLNGNLSGRISRLLCLVAASFLFSLRINNGDNFASIVAVCMAFGLFSLTHLVAGLMVHLICAKRRSSGPTSVGMRGIFCQAIVASSLISLAWLYSLSFLILILMIFYTIISQVRRVSFNEEILLTKAVKTVQIGVILLSLMAPWMTVSIQNLWRHQSVLPHDPMMVPSALWIVGSLLAGICESHRLKLAVTLIIGTLSAGFCDKLYVIIYCGGVLLGFYSSAFCCKLPVSVNKVD